MSRKKCTKCGSMNVATDALVGEQWQHPTGVVLLVVLPAFKCQACGAMARRDSVEAMARKLADQLVERRAVERAEAKLAVVGQTPRP